MRPVRSADNRIAGIGSLVHGKEEGFRVVSKDEGFEMEEPKVGGRPIYGKGFWLEWEDKKEGIKTMLDSGCDLPVISADFARKHQVPVTR